MVPQAVNQGTVTPVAYNVICDETNLKPHQLQLFAFQLCHLYYNWQGLYSILHIVINVNPDTLSHVSFPVMIFYRRIVVLISGVFRQVDCGLYVSQSESVFNFRYDSCASTLHVRVQAGLHDQPVHPRPCKGQGLPGRQALLPLIAYSGVLVWFR